MLDKFFSAIKDFIVAGELTRLNSIDVRELRKQYENQSLLIEKLAFEIQRLRDNEAHEREKLLLKVENIVARDDRNTPVARKTRKLPGK